MMGLLERYVLGKALALFAGLTGLALAILLLERLLRVVELVSGSTGNMTAAARLIVNLVPHYLEMALPAALFLSVLITIDRISRSGELVAMMGAGVSLFRVVRPFMIAAALLAAIMVFITGFLQPLSRYDYRQIAHDIRQQSVETAFQEGKFAHVGDWVVWTDHAERQGRVLGGTFILEYQADGSRRFLSAPSGGLVGEGDELSRIVLQDGRGGDLPVGGQAISGLGFETLYWTLPHEMAPFRARGGDARELTLPELFAVAGMRQEAGVEPHIAAAGLHDQLSRALLMLALPLLAVPLGLSYGRAPRTGGIAIGIVLMLVVQKALEYGLIVAERGTVPAWASLWPIVLVISATGVVLFWRSAQRVSTPPLMNLSLDVARIARGIRPPASGRA